MLFWDGCGRLSWECGSVPHAQGKKEEGRKKVGRQLGSGTFQGGGANVAEGKFVCGDEVRGMCFLWPC